MYPLLFRISFKTMFFFKIELCLFLASSSWKSSRNPDLDILFMDWIINNLNALIIHVTSIQ